MSSTVTSCNINEDAYTCIYKNIQLCILYIVLLFFLASKIWWTKLSICLLWLVVYVNQCCRNSWNSTLLLVIEGGTNNISNGSLPFRGGSRLAQRAQLSPAPEQSKRGSLLWKVAPEWNGDLLKSHMCLNLNFRRTMWVNKHSGLSYLIILSLFTWKVSVMGIEDGKHNNS